MTTQPNTGPEDLRWLADGEAANDGRGLSPAYLRDLAAAWEADIATITRLASSTASLLARAERAEAALERARALADKWLAVAEHSPMSSKVIFQTVAYDLIAALAPDGAPTVPAAPTCDLCKIQAGIQAAMDIIEPLPDIGDHYDAMVTRAFDALDDAYGYHKHEHPASDGAR